MSVVSAPPTLANDHIFPPAPAAKASIDFDGHGFLLHGRRTFLVSAGMEYARVPRALWRDRLLRLKRAGFNCVEMYTFWDFHEPREGQFDFTGDHDLNAYLRLVHQMGMYAICRVMPVPFNPAARRSSADTPRRGRPRPDPTGRFGRAMRQRPPCPSR